ncbi:hypothetical protein [Actinokineospora sp.]|uniref:hypothetical protein n=1 Tax=Actinokineospora sp. TaxID=1872133 RepID=UPI004037FAED
MAPLQSGQFAPAQSGVGGGDGHQRGGGWHSTRDGVDFVAAGVWAFGAAGEIEAEFAAWVGADESLVVGFAEDHGEQDDDVLHALVGQRGT